MKVLITGITGNVGSHLADYILNNHRDIELHGIARWRSPMDNIEKIKHKINIELADLNDLSSLIYIMNKIKPDYIFHLAAQSLVRESYEKPIETFSTNILGTVNVLDCIRNSATIKGCIVYTSDKCYENIGTKQAYNENDRLGGNDPYSASKASSEIVTTAYRNSFFSKITSPRIATIRAGNVIGGGDWSKDRLIPDFVRAVINKQKINVRNPEHTRPWQFVLEPLSGILWLAVKMIQESKYSEAWNFGPSSDSKQFTLKMMLKAISTEWGINESIMEENTNNELHEDKFLNIDSSKAEKFLGLKLVYNLQETITETVSWYKHFTEQKNEIKNFSIEQIKNYTDHAKQLNLSWT